MTTPQEEREAALAAYRAASAEFDLAQQAWDPFLAGTGAAAASGATDATGTDGEAADPAAADAAFDRLTRAYHARLDAVDSLWLASRNRPSA